MAIDKNLTGWNSLSSGPLRSGPMLGEVGENDAYVWAQANGTPSNPPQRSATWTRRNRQPGISKRNPGRFKN